MISAAAVINSLSMTCLASERAAAAATSMAFTAVVNGSFFGQP
jgi:hypothetical protein